MSHSPSSPPAPLLIAGSRSVAGLAVSTDEDFNLVTSGRARSLLTRLSAVFIELDASDVNLWGACQW